MSSKSKSILCGTPLAALAFLTFSQVGARAQLLDYSDFAGYGLGKGILGNDFGQPLSSCVTGIVSKLPASKSSVRVSIVYSANEYKQAFHVDQNAQASYLKVASGGDELHIGRETGSSGSAFDVVLEAYGEHDSDTIGNLKWDAPYAAMIASSDPAKIQQVRIACGDRFIETVFNEARIFAVLHVSSQKTSALTTFAGKANGSVNLDTISASGMLGGDANVSSANQSGAIDIEIFSEGIGGVVPTASMVGIAASDGLVGIASKLSNHLGTLTATGQPVKYQLAPLPGMHAEDLTDSRIFDYLNDLKADFAKASFRLSNVDQLLTNDPRRILFRQPQADAELQQQKLVLEKFVDTVSEAHDSCRKADNLKPCSVAVNNLALPPLAKVELPPIIPLGITLYGFAINGVLVAPNQNGQVMASGGTTLYNAAKGLNQAAVNVDVVAYIASAYMSQITLISMTPNPPAIPTTLGSMRILSQDMVAPAYFPADVIGSFIRVIHADALHPCPISKSNGMSLIDSNCLTSSGRAILDVALSDVANYVVAAPAGMSKSYDVPVIGFLQDCFTPGAFPLPVAGLHIDVSPGASSEVTAKASLTLAMPDSLLFLLDQTENHDLGSWNKLKQSRLASFKALNTADVALAASAPCSPHIPEAGK